MADKKPISSRRGRAVKGEKKAEFRAGSAAGPKGFDAGRVASDLNLWWENGDGTSFLVGDRSGEVWSRWPERKVLNLFKLHYVRLKLREGDLLSEADQVLMHAMRERRLELAMAGLAGYRAGVHDVGGQRVLVRTSPRLVEPKEGEWKTIEALLRSKLDFSYGDDEGHGVDQVAYFHGWMKTALEGLYLGGPGNFRPGQCLIFAGPKDSGKSRIQHQLVTAMLGGRSADPGPYLFGRTDFNGEMFSAEHLMMEDPASSTKTVDRVYFGEMLKQLVVNDTQRLHRKREDAIVVSPFFRTTISINDDPDKMRVLPLLTPDMKDKVSLFLISPHALPLPTNTLAERAAFRDAIASELGAYAWWLLNVFEIPEALRSVRFGVKEWHHPQLAMELFDDTPAAELLQVIDAATWDRPPDDLKLWQMPDVTREESDEASVRWEGTALELEALLLKSSCSVEREAKRLFMHNKIDRLLGRLREDQPGRVGQHRVRNVRRWFISSP